MSWSGAIASSSLVGSGTRRYSQGKGGNELDKNAHKRKSCDEGHKNNSQSCCIILVTVYVACCLTLLMTSVPMGTNG